MLSTICVCVCGCVFLFVCVCVCVCISVSVKDRLKCIVHQVGYGLFMYFWMFVLVSV